MCPSNLPALAGFDRINFKNVRLVMLREGMILLVQGNCCGIVIDSDIHGASDSKFKPCTPSSSAAEAVYGDFVE